MTRASFDHEKNLKIISNPKYHELVSKRSTFGWTLAVVMLVVYFGFIGIIAAGGEFFAQPLAEGMTTTIGMPVGVAVIVIAVALTGIYVRRANSEFDDLTRQIIEEAHL